MIILPVRTEISGSMIKEDMRPCTPHIDFSMRSIYWKNDQVCFVVGSMIFHGQFTAECR